MKITISAKPNLSPLKHPWSKCITVGRAYELLRADAREHLLCLQREFDYRFIRFHASFHDDVAVVHKLPDGEIVYRWTQLDHIYDFLVEAGFDPIVELTEHSIKGSYAIEVQS
ncbi:MAG: GH39 family glycosyl hydrolase [Oceanipulchritudo sp.]